jgi:hypothetical protein
MSPMSTFLWGSAITVSTSDHKIGQVFLTRSGRVFLVS